VFEITNSSVNSIPEVQETSILTSNKTSNSSLSSLKTKQLNESSNDDTDQTIVKTKQKLSKSRSYSSCDYEITKKSIENIIYEHALFLLVNFRIQQLFGMVANLNEINFFKWLDQYQ
jgi:hypothetical protein